MVKALAQVTLSTPTLILLAIAVMLNAADRGSLATVAPVLGHEMHLTNTQLGVLLSSFFWVYAPAQLLAGRLVERFRAKYILAAGFTLWALATLATGLAGGFATLVLMRLLLGLGESAMFPALSKLLAERTAEGKRGIANAWCMIGLSVGPSLGTLAGGSILASHGWRPVFWIFGAVSLLWLVPWLANTLPSAAAHAAGPAPGYREIMRHRAAWGMACGHFCVNYMGYFLITWMPLYLVNGRHFTIAQMTWAGTLIFAAEAASVIGSAMVTDRMVRAGVSITAARAGALSLGTAMVALFMLACAVVPAPWAVPCLVLAAIGRGMQLPAMYAVAQTFAGPRAGGTWMGFQNFIGNLAGIAGPYLTGLVVDATGGFTLAFVLIGLVSFCGFACWRFVIGPVTQVAWRAA